jgi:hypothetical protein
MAFTDPMFQLGMRLTMQYSEFTDTVVRVVRLMEKEKSVHYALGYMMQSYISLASRTNRLESELEHMQQLERGLRDMQSSIPTSQQSA